MISSLTALVLVLAVTPAEVDHAKALYRAGADAFRTGKYAIAIDAFKAAREVSERPVVVFSLAQAYRLHYVTSRDLADLEAAVQGYRDYLALEPDGPRQVHATQHLSMLAPYLDNLQMEGPEAQAKVEQAARLIVTSSVPEAEAQVDGGPAQPVPANFEVEVGLHTVRVTAPRHTPSTQQIRAVAGSAVAVVLEPEPQPGTISLTAPSGARVFLDERPVGEAPLAAPIEVAPGTHHLVVRSTGRQPQSQQLVLGPGQAVALDVALEPTGQRTLAWVLMGTAGALAISAGVTGAYALDAQSEANTLKDRLGKGLTGTEYDRYSQLRADRDAFSDATLALGVATGATLATGLLLYFFDDPSPPRLTPGAGLGAVAWAF